MARSSTSLLLLLAAAAVLCVCVAGSAQGKALLATVMQEAVHSAPAMQQAQHQSWCECVTACPINTARLKLSCIPLVGCAGADVSHDQPTRKLLQGQGNGRGPEDRGNRGECATMQYPGRCMHGAYVSGCGRKQLGSSLTWLQQQQHQQHNSLMMLPEHECSASPPRSCCPSPPA